MSLLISFLQCISKRANDTDDNDIWKDKEIILYHRTSTCGGCGINPIIGERYKCSVCPNYCLCQKCKTLENCTKPCDLDHYMPLNNDGGETDEIEHVQLEDSDVFREKKLDSGWVWCLLFGCRSGWGINISGTSPLGFRVF